MLGGGRSCLWDHGHAALVWLCTRQMTRRSCVHAGPAAGGPPDACLTRQQACHCPSSLLLGYFWACPPKVLCQRLGPQGGTMGRWWGLSEVGPGGRLGIGGTPVSFSFFCFLLTAELFCPGTHPGRMCHPSQRPRAMGLLSLRLETPEPGADGPFLLISGCLGSSVSYGDGW